METKQEEVSTNTAEASPGQVGGKTITLGEALKLHEKHIQHNKIYAKKWTSASISVSQLQLICNRHSKGKPLFRDIKPPVEKHMVTNPDSKRKIVVGTRTYEKLVKEGKITPSFCQEKKEIGIQTDMKGGREIKPIFENNLGELGKKKMNWLEKRNLLKDVEKLDKEWDLILKVDPSRLKEEEFCYFLDVLDVKIQKCLVNKERLFEKKPSFVQQKWLERIQNLPTKTPQINRIKRHVKSLSRSVIIKPRASRKSYIEKIASKKLNKK